MTHGMKISFLAQTLPWGADSLAVVEDQKVPKKRRLQLPGDVCVVYWDSVKPSNS